VLGLCGISRAEDPKPIKALLITGGPFHDYTKQKQDLTEGISKRANVQWTIYHEGDKGGTKFELPIYNNPDWAKGYDVVVHNECFADVTDEAFIKRVCKPHEDGVAGIFIHCCMHTFRAVKTTDEYRHMLGVTTVRHETARMLEVKPVKSDHPIMKGFPDVFKTPVIDEAYVIEKVWPDCTPLATTFGVETQKNHPCIWVNQYGKARIFGTTLGHPNEVIESPVFLDTLARALLWTCNKLGDDGKPIAGYGPAK
jgi:type 1 glutamine amidotransferase